MRFDIFSVSLTAAALVACASARTAPDGANRTDSRLGAAYNPCASKNPGEACTLCPPGDLSCVETMELKVCDASGLCSSQSAPVPPASYDPCAGKNAGDTCKVCDPTDPSCVETMELKVCNASGACTSQVTPPRYDPCGGKKAGETCTLCDPADIGCVETAVLKVCDGGGVCR